MIQNFEVVKSTTMEEVYADTAPGWKVLACRAGTQDRAQTVFLLMGHFRTEPVIGLSS